MADPWAQFLPQTSRGGATDTDNLHGEEYLQNESDLTKEDRAAVRAISQYKVPGTGRNIQQYLPYVAQFDPTFDETRYQPNVALRRSFESGPDADQIKTYKTTIGHAAGLDDAIDRMHNFTVLPGPINSVMQAWKNNTGNQQFQAAYADFTTHRAGVASELAKAFRQQGMAEADVQDWKSRIMSTDSPVALHQSVRSALDMLGSRMAATRDKWNNAFPNEQKTVEGMLGPDAGPRYSQILSKGLMADTQGAGAPQQGQGEVSAMGAAPAQPAGAPAAVGATPLAPPQQNAPAPAAAPPGGYPEGTRGINPQTGKKIIVQGGRWVPMQ
jgi:hypothetical protein